MRMRVPSHVFVAIACALCLIAGCGSSYPKTVPVSGVVTYNGKPVVGAAVAFIPVHGGRPASGQTDDQGKYILTTFKFGDGATLGSHQVVVDHHKVVRAGEPGFVPNSEGDSVQFVWLLPKKYSRAETSGLQATIDGPREDCNFDL